MGTAHFTTGDEATADKFNASVIAEGPSLGNFVWFARVKYNGSSWEVDANHSSAGITTGALTWDGTDDELEITLTDFASYPVVIATPVAADSNLLVKAHAQSATKAVVRFYSDATTKVTTEATTMDCNVLIIGNYLT